MRLPSSEMRKPAVCGMRRIPVASGSERRLGRSVSGRAITSTSLRLVPRTVMLPCTSDTSIRPGRDGSLNGTVTWSADGCCCVAAGVDRGDEVASAADVHATDTNPINTIGTAIELTNLHRAVPPARRARTLPFSVSNVISGPPLPTRTRVNSLAR